jgi:hypothetical protein
LVALALVGEVGGPHDHVVAHSGLEPGQGVI